MDEDPDRDSALRALVVAYPFPPVGGAGVARMAKLVKYLPGLGVQTAVLTVSNPSVPLLDHSREGDLPEGVEVVRVRTLEPGYAMKAAAWKEQASATVGLWGRGKRALSGAARQLLVPDPQILWQPAAQAALAGRLLRRRDDVVLISGPPFSQFLLAPLCHLGGAALVLDYRDEWSTYRTTYEMMGKGAAVVGERLEAFLVGRADVITAATEAFRENLLARFPSLDPARVITIPNGYDSEDVCAELPPLPRDRFVITYAGTLFKLTSPVGLLGAIARLHAAEPELARLLDVRFYGRVVDTEAAAFAGSEALGVRRLGYLPHDEVKAVLAASHLDLVLLAYVPGSERVYPAKAFELMAIGRPTLTLAPPGALSELVTRHRLGALLRPGDEAGIAAFLADALRAFRDGRYPESATAVDIERYHRRALAGEFAQALRLAVATRRG